MTFVLAVTLYDLGSWLVFLVLPKLRYSFFAQRIPVQQGLTTVRTGMHAFVYEYLQHDGFFILRLIHSNVGDDVTVNILTNLWKNFQRTDKSSAQENTIANLGATVSLTATGNSQLDSHGRSIFDYSKTTTNV
jgi:hypothetical protein